MLDTLRNSSQSLFAKIIMVLLIGSFVFWGIGDIFRQSYGDRSVATIGKTSISPQEFGQALQQKQQEWQQRLGDAYKPELLKKMGLEQQVLANLINHKMFEEEARNIGIEVSDNALRKAIMAMPVFLNDEKKFSKDQYAGLLQSNGLTEKQFLANLRRELASGLLTDTLVNPSSVPEAWVKAVYQAKEEQRVADMIIVGPAALKNIVAPTDKEIENWYEAHKDLFQTPELRTVSYIVMTPASVQSGLAVSDEEIQQAYTEREPGLRQPERRTVAQMLFDSEETAKTAVKELTQGKAFMDVAKTSPILNKDKISLGTLTKDDLPPEIAGTVFGLKKDTIYQPVKSDFGWHVFQVSAIQPASVPSLEKMRPELNKELLAKQSQSVLDKTATSMEDTLAGGASLEEAAEKTGQKIVTVGPFTQDGRNESGKKITLPAYENFLNVAFSTPEHETSRAEQMSDGSYILLQVKQVTPKANRPLAEVKTKIAAAILEEKKQTALKTTADAIVKEIEKGKKPADVALAHQAEKPVTSGKIKRSSESLTSGPLASTLLPQELVEELFQVEQLKPTRAYPLQNGRYIIAVPTQMIAAGAVMDKKTYQTVETALQNDIIEETLHYTLAHLREKYRVTIHQSAMKSRDEETADNIQ